MLCLRVFRSRIVTVEDWPSLTKPRPSSEAMAMPVHSRSIGDLAYDRARVYIENFNLRSVGDV
jgi:hypothetical protein